MRNNNNQDLKIIIYTVILVLVTIITIGEIVGGVKNMMSMISVQPNDLQFKITDNDLQKTLSKTIRITNLGEGTRTICFYISSPKDVIIKAPHYMRFIENRLNYIDIKNKILKLDIVKINNNLTNINDNIEKTDMLIANLYGIRKRGLDDNGINRQNNLALRTDYLIDRVNSKSNIINGIINDADRTEDVSEIIRSVESDLSAIAENQESISGFYTGITIAPNEESIGDAIFMNISGLPGIPDGQANFAMVRVVLTNKISQGEYNGEIRICEKDKTCESPSETTPQNLSKLPANPEERFEPTPKTQKPLETIPISISVDYSKEEAQPSPTEKASTTNATKS